MKFKIITLFPEMFEKPLSSSILKRAKEKGVFEAEIVNLRDFGLGTRKQVDETPYGGGAGMVLRADVMAKAIYAAKTNFPKAKIILLTPQGEVYSQKQAEKFAQTKNDLILICGHYEGFDERIRKLADMELSIGQFVLTGGELAAMVVVDSIVRLLPKALGHEESAKDESFSEKDRIEYPQYTKPEKWRGQNVPAVLLSGHHSEIKKWRDGQAKIKSDNYKKRNSVANIKKIC